MRHGPCCSAQLVLSQGAAAFILRQLLLAEMLIGRTGRSLFCAACVSVQALQ